MLITNRGNFYYGVDRVVAGEVKCIRFHTDQSGKSVCRITSFCLVTTKVIIRVTEDECS